MSRSVHNSLRVLLLATIPLAVAGCPLINPPGDNKPGDGTARLKGFDSPEALMQYFRQQALASAARSYDTYTLRDGLPLAETSTGAPADAADTGGSQAFSQTNLQEEGVDEGDVIKSDGTYFYVARDQSLRIVRASPPEQLAEVGRLDLDLNVSELYLRDSAVIAIASRYGPVYGGAVPEILIYPPYYVSSDVVVLDIDVSDPANPTVRKRAELDGSLVASRLTNDRLILVLTVAPELPPNPTPLSLALLGLGDVMPKMRTAARETDAVPWQDWLRPDPSDGYFMTAVVTLDAADIESKLASVAILAAAGTIYASQDAVYVTDTDYDANNDYRETTSIHKFRFDENGAAGYVASGSVPGRLLNQFSLGEHEGYLRAATYVENFSVAPLPAGGSPGVALREQSSEPPAPSNAVYVLAESGADLNVAGKVEGIAPNERIYSARFLGKRGFLVTFRQIDPLFALDLSDPTAPQIVGELKIPGFSDYLHVFRGDYLIGVGRATAARPWGGVVPDALQLSLFDVHDLSNPTLIQQVEIGGYGSYSDVSYTHKAFTLMEEEGLLAIPATLLTGDPFTGETVVGEDGAPVGAASDRVPEPFSGVLCYRVDPSTGFTEVGRLRSAAPESEPYFLYQPVWRRAAFIGDTVYAVSSDGVAAAPLSAMDQTTSIVFGE